MKTKICKTCKGSGFKESKEGVLLGACDKCLGTGEIKEKDSKKKNQTIRKGK
jgi:hypothetical protein